MPVNAMSATRRAREISQLRELSASGHAVVAPEWPVEITQQNRWKPT